MRKQKIQEFSDRKLKHSQIRTQKQIERLYKAGNKKLLSKRLIYNIALLEEILYRIETRDTIPETFKIYSDYDVLFQYRDYVRMSISDLETLLDQIFTTLHNTTSEAVQSALIVRSTAIENILEYKYRRIGLV